MHYTCPHCGAINRLPQLNTQARCGRCKDTLLATTPIELTDPTFTRFLAKNDLPIVIDFWASWCGPCQTMAPVFQQVSSQLNQHARFAKVNTEQAPTTSNQWGIRSIPTLIVIQNGEEVDRLAGALPPAALQQWIERALQQARTRYT